MDKKIEIDESVLAKLLKDAEKNKKSIEERMDSLISKTLYWIGITMSFVTIIAHLFLTFFFIVGSSVDMEVINTRVWFTGISAVFGMFVAFGLKYQGVIIAANIDENKKVIKAYQEALLNNRYKKEAKPKPISSFMLWSTVVDFFTKTLTVGLSMGGMIYFVVAGNGDWALLWIMLSQTLVSLSFGIYAMSKSYNKYNQSHIEYLKMKTIESIEESKVKPEPKEVYIEPKLEVKQELATPFTHDYI